MLESVSVLIVDDNPSMAGALADVLEAKNYTVYTASSGAAAIAVLREHPVHILLTDVVMPDMNGVELYLSTRSDHPGLVTIFMTAYAADDLIQQGMRAGIKTVLTKPIDMDFLLYLLSAARSIFR
jgi:YesN/AraC family two-component response regulator